jgi:hydroxymethylglutaryl-CoA lyase
MEVKVSISETFQQRNTNSSINESLQRVEAIQNLCHKNNKELLVYISMAFGNPYGDDWSADIAINWGHQLSAMGIRHLALADTTGSSTPATITQLFSNLIPALKDVELSAHLHSLPQEAREKIAAAYLAGCRKFDVAIHGFGGCPMASDSLTGNISTEALESYAIEQKLDLQLNTEALRTAYDMSWEIFNHYH